MKTLLMILLLSAPLQAEQYRFLKYGSGVIRLSDNASIPNQTDNRDWKEYQVWVALGNITLPADPLPTAPEILAALRVAAVAELNVNTASSAKVLRAVFLVALDEINLLRQRDVDRAVDVAAATSLADLKVRWAARSTLSDRTSTQFKNAVEGKITSGASD